MMAMVLGMQGPRYLRQLASTELVAYQPKR